MKTVKYKIKLNNLNTPKGTISVLALRELVERLIDASEKALKLAIDGTSSKKGQPPAWLKASVDFLVTGLKEGSTVIEMDCPTLKETAKEKIAQRDLWSIVPDGVLFGTSNAHIDLRKILIDKCKLEGIISMPSGVFKPYAGVSTAVIVFQKGGITDKVWFYDMQADGYSLDDKRNKTDVNDIPDIIKHWQVGRTGCSTYNKAIQVDVKDIKENKYDLSISRYKKIEYEEVEYEMPEAIMEKVLKLENEIAKDISEIKKLIK